MAQESSSSPIELRFDAACIAGRVCEGVRLRILDGRIVAVDPVARPGNGRGVLPGFVNAHSHLDLSLIDGREFARGSFPVWAEELLRVRQSLARADFERAVRIGCAALLETGTVAVGDIDSCGFAADVLTEFPFEGATFHEWVGEVGPHHVDEFNERRAAAGERSLRRGLSPHAPFSTSELAYSLALSTCSSADAPLATHLGETRAEAQYLQSGGGPFAEWFARHGFAAPKWSAPGAGMITRVLELMANPARRPKWVLAVHCNYPAAGDLALLRGLGVRVVYCPRSHEYFGHEPHPLPRLLEHGIPVALGTDSTASNSSLDLWQEMACVRRQFPALPARRILDLATRDGRRCLELPKAELCVGDPATFQVVAARDGTRPLSTDLIEDAVAAELHTVETWIDGRRVWQRSGG